MVHERYIPPDDPDASLVPRIGTPNHGRHSADPIDPTDSQRSLPSRYDRLPSIDGRPTPSNITNPSNEH